MGKYENKVSCKYFKPHRINFKIVMEVKDTINSQVCDGTNLSFSD